MSLLNAAMILQVCMKVRVVCATLISFFFFFFLPISSSVNAILNATKMLAAVVVVVVLHAWGAALECFMCIAIWCCNVSTGGGGGGGLYCKDLHVLSMWLGNHLYFICCPSLKFNKLFFPHISVLWKVMTLTNSVVSVVLLCSILS